MITPPALHSAIQGLLDGDAYLDNADQERLLYAALLIGTAPKSEGADYLLAEIALRWPKELGRLCCDAMQVGTMARGLLTEKLRELLHGEEERGTEAMLTMNATQHERMLDVLDLVRNERYRQHEKWGEQEHQDALWLAILMEEVGEAAKAALDSRPGSQTGSDTREHYEEELIQVAAVAVAAVEDSRRRRATVAAIRAAAERVHLRPGSA